MYFLPFQPDPIITMIGNQTKEFVLRTPKGPLLTLCHIYDADGNELVFYFYYFYILRVI
jgi:hypothetical protein